MSKINDFVTYEIAILAKEKGFDESCVGYFKNEKLYMFDFRDAITQEVIPFWTKNSKSSWFSTMFSSKEKVKKNCTAPTHTMLIQWFLDKHNIDISVNGKLTFVGDNLEWYFEYTIIKNNILTLDTITYSKFEKKEQAFNKALLHAFSLI